MLNRENTDNQQTVGMKLGTLQYFCKAGGFGWFFNLLL